MPGTVLSPLHRLLHFILTTSTWSRYCFQCTDIKQKNRGSAHFKNWSKATQSLGQEAGCKLRGSASGALALTQRFLVPSLGGDNGSFPALLSRNQKFLCKSFSCLPRYFNKDILKNYFVKYSETCLFLTQRAFLSTLANTLIKHFHGFIILHLRHKP